LSETIRLGNDASMRNRRTYDTEGHAHFLTFSCYKRRRLLDVDRAKKIVLGMLTSQLARQQGRCAGFVVMPNHVHAIVWFAADSQISEFVKHGSTDRRFRSNNSSTQGLFLIAAPSTRTTLSGRQDFMNSTSTAQRN
jgi:REP element-mobilizing transposase RayT